jgi:alkylation response protein AidB-like acyl-CoA dehydrogenase
VRPFAEPRHEDLRGRARDLALMPDADVPAWLTRLREADLLRLPPRDDVRTLCVLREELAYGSPLADVALALQGLGTYALVRFGGGAPEGVAAFAVTEPEAGSDLHGIRTTARRDGARFVIDGKKTFISNAPVADFFTLFARTAEGKNGLSAFFVAAKQPGLRVVPQEVSDPHPIGEVILDGAVGDLVGREGQGFEIAVATLEVFRVSVGAAACGMARRAFDEALAHARVRRQFGQAIARFQLVQGRLAEMATELDAARLLVFRAAALHDGGSPCLRESSMAKLFATEAAQRIVDGAVQILGGNGVRRGHPVERLYRAVRALRIYEGTSEIQKLIIAKDLIGA